MNEFVGFCSEYSNDAVKARVKKLEMMLQADFGFKCRMSEESKLQKLLQDMRLHDDEDLPQIVDVN